MYPRGIKFPFVLPSTPAKYSVAAHSPQKTSATFHTILNTLLNTSRPQTAIPTIHQQIDQRKSFATHNAPDPSFPPKIDVAKSENHHILRSRFHQLRTSPEPENTTVSRHSKENPLRTEGIQPSQGTESLDTTSEQLAVSPKTIPQNSFPKKQIYTPSFAPSILIPPSVQSHLSAFEIHQLFSLLSSLSSTNFPDVHPIASSKYTVTVVPVAESSRRTNEKLRKTGDTIPERWTLKFLITQNENHSPQAGGTVFLHSQHYPPQDVSARTNLAQLVHYLTKTIALLQAHNAKDIRIELLLSDATFISSIPAAKIPTLTEQLQRISHQIPGKNAHPGSKNIAPFNFPQPRVQQQHAETPLNPSVFKTLPVLWSNSQRKSSKPAQLSDSKTSSPPIRRSGPPPLSIQRTETVNKPIQNIGAKALSQKIAPRKTNTNSSFPGPMFKKTNAEYFIQQYLQNNGQERVPTSTKFSLENAQNFSLQPLLRSGIKNQQKDSRNFSGVETVKTDSPYSFKAQPRNRPGYKNIAPFDGYDRSIFSSTRAQSKAFPKDSHTFTALINQELVDIGKAEEKQWDHSTESFAHSPPSPRAGTLRLWASVVTQRSNKLYERRTLHLPNRTGVIPRASSPGPTLRIPVHTTNNPSEPLKSTSSAPNANGTHNTPPRIIQEIKPLINGWNIQGKEQLQILTPLQPGWSSFLSSPLNLKSLTSPTLKLRGMQQIHFAEKNLTARNNSVFHKPRMLSLQQIFSDFPESPPILQRKSLKAQGAPLFTHIEIQQPSVTLPQSIQKTTHRESPLHSLHIPYLLPTSKKITLAQPRFWTNSPVHLSTAQHIDIEKASELLKRESSVSTKYARGNEQLSSALTQKSIHPELITLLQNSHSPSQNVGEVLLKKITPPSLHRDNLPLARNPEQEKLLSLSALYRKTATSFLQKSENPHEPGRTVSSTQTLRPTFFNQRTQVHNTGNIEGVPHSIGRRTNHNRTAHRIIITEAIQNGIIATPSTQSTAEQRPTLQLRPEAFVHQRQRIYSEKLRGVLLSTPHRILPKSGHHHSGLTNDSEHGNLKSHQLQQQNRIAASGTGIKSTIAESHRESRITQKNTQGKTIHSDKQRVFRTLPSPVTLLNRTLRSADHQQKYHYQTEQSSTMGFLYSAGIRNHPLFSQALPPKSENREFYSPHQYTEEPKPLQFWSAAKFYPRQKVQEKQQNSRNQHHSRTSNYPRVLPDTFLKSTEQRNKINVPQPSAPLLPSLNKSEQVHIAREPANSRKMQQSIKPQRDTHILSKSIPTLVSDTTIHNWQSQQQSGISHNVRPKIPPFTPEATPETVLHSTSKSYSTLERASHRASNTTPLSPPTHQSLLSIRMNSWTPRTVWAQQVLPESQIVQSSSIRDRTTGHLTIEQRIIPDSAVSAPFRPKKTESITPSYRNTPIRSKEEPSLSGTSSAALYQVWLSRQNSLFQEKGKQISNESTPDPLQQNARFASNTDNRVQLSRENSKKTSYSSELQFQMREVRRKIALNPSLSQQESQILNVLPQIKIQEPQTLIFHPRVTLLEGTTQQLNLQEQKEQKFGDRNPDERVTSQGQSSKTNGENGQLRPSLYIRNSVLHNLHQYTTLFQFHSQILHKDNLFPQRSATEQPRSQLSTIKKNYSSENRGKLSQRSPETMIPPEENFNTTPTILSMQQKQRHFAEIIQPPEVQTGRATNTEQVPTRAAQPFLNLQTEGDPVKVIRGTEKPSRSASPTSLSGKQILTFTFPPIPLTHLSSVLYRMVRTLQENRAPIARARFTLNPPILGEVEVSLKILDGNSLSLTMLVQKAQTQKEFENRLPKLQEALSQHGLRLEEIRIQNKNGANNHPAFEAEHSLQDSYEQSGQSKYDYQKEYRTLLFTLRQLSNDVT